jgi:hypothetical protein
VPSLYQNGFMYVSMLRLYVLLSLRNKVYVETKKKILVGAKFFAHVQTGPGGHPASCTMGTGSFPEVKRPGRGADHPPLLVCRSKKRVELHLYPSLGVRVCYGVPLPLPIALHQPTPACPLVIELRNYRWYKFRYPIYHRVRLML